MIIIQEHSLKASSKRKNTPATTGCDSGGQWGGKITQNYSKLDAIKQKSRHAKRSYFKLFEVV